MSCSTHAQTRLPADAGYMTTTPHARSISRFSLTDLTLVLAWLVSLFAPLAWAGLTSDTLFTLNKAVVVASILMPVAVAIAAGSHYRRRQDTNRIWTAFVFGSLTGSIVGIATNLANGSPDLAPWGFVVIVNTVVYTAGTGTSIALGAAAARWLRSSQARRARQAC